jgi:hypothetical protein
MLSHSFVRQRLTQPQLDDAIGQQPQRPPLETIRGFTTSFGDQPRFGFA